MNRRFRNIRLCAFLPRQSVLATFVLFGLMLFASGAQAFDLQASLLGEWRESAGGEGETFKVLDGGEVLLKVYGVSVKGQYTVLDSNRILFETFFGSMVYSVRVSDFTLRLIDDENNTRTYDRWVSKASASVISPDTCSSQ